MTEVLHKISEVRNIVSNWKKQGLSVGLVPTMGALHIGHASLVKKSVETCDKTVVSVFVNPTQFGINEDFSTYPRTLEADTELVEKCCGDIVFAPSAEEMYGEKYDKNNLTLVCPPYDMVNKLCGKTRPGHFDGVASVVSKLFNIVQPDYAFFGQKDAQQLVIIEKMVRDLNFPIEIVGCPIVREENGLAMSSRNNYLSKEEKNSALSLSKALFSVKKAFESGIVDTQTLFEVGVQNLQNAVELEYLDFLDYDIFEKVDTINSRVLVAICARIGTTRLIDNIIIGQNENKENSHC